MTLRLFLEEKFDFDLQANLAWIHLLQASDDASEFALKSMSHIINVHHIWQARLLGKTPESHEWDRLPLLFMEQLAQANYRETAEYLQYELTPEVIRYTDREGALNEKENFDMLYHILNHSNYHRAQISLERRNAGQSVVATNFIVFK